MVVILWLIEIAKKAITNKYILAALIGAALFAAGYVKGITSERAREMERRADETTQQMTDVVTSVVVQEKLEAAHDKRVRKILSAPVLDVDAGLMLSTWPDEIPATK